VTIKYTQQKELASFYNAIKPLTNAPKIPKTVSKNPYFPKKNP